MSNTHCFVIGFAHLVQSHRPLPVTVNVTIPPLFIQPVSRATAVGDHRNGRQGEALLVHPTDPASGMFAT